jgi:hypothetical protein
MFMFRSSFFQQSHSLDHQHASEISRLNAALEESEEARLRLEEEAAKGNADILEEYEKDRQVRIWNILVYFLNAYC